MVKKRDQATLLKMAKTQEQATLLTKCHEHTIQCDEWESFWTLVQYHSKFLHMHAFQVVSTRAYNLYDERLHMFVALLFFQVRACVRVLGIVTCSVTCMFIIGLLSIQTCLQTTSSYHTSVRHIWHACASRMSLGILNTLRLHGSGHAWWWSVYTRKAALTEMIKRTRPWYSEPTQAIVHVRTCEAWDMWSNQSNSV